MVVVVVVAAVHAAFLSGDPDEHLRALVLRDVAPLSLGVGREKNCEQMSTVIARNTPIPVTHSHGFATKDDNQTDVRFPVYEGERPLTKDNVRCVPCNLEQLYRRTYISLGISMPVPVF